EIGRWNHHPRPERDAIEVGTVATGNRREHSSGQLALGDILKLENIDQIRSWCDAARRFSDQLGLLSCQRRRRRDGSETSQSFSSGDGSFLHRKCVLTNVRSMEASVGRPVSAIAITSSPCRISRIRCTPAGPYAASPQRIARPKQIAFAPKARAL